MQEPLIQVSFNGSQAFPHAPQCSELVNKFTQSLPHLVNPEEHLSNKNTTKSTIPKTTNNDINIEEEFSFFLLTNIFFCKKKRLHIKTIS